MAIKKIKVKEKSFDLSYLLLDNKQCEWIVILHGWGANKELMYQTFKDCFKAYNHLYIDLPGFGNSSNDYVLDSRQYASVVERFLEVLKITPEIILGHSFGGKVALLLNPKRLILLSSAGLLKKKSLKVKLKIKLAKISRLLKIKTNIFLSKDALNLSQNMYETFKIVVNEDFSTLFEGFCNEAFIFWGRDDEATPLYLGEKMHTLIKDSKFYVFNGGHFFFLENANNIDRIFDGE